MRRLIKLATAVVAPVVMAGLGVVATAPAASAAYGSGLPDLLRELENQTAVQIRTYDPSTLPIPSCDAPGVSLCLDNPTPTGTSFAVPSLDLNPTAITHVTAYLTFYEVKVGAVRVGVVPCIVMTAPGSANGCAAAQLDPSTALPPVPLVDEDVARFDPSIGPTLVTIGVCSATARLKVNGGDAADAPVFTPCTS